MTNSNLKINLRSIACFNHISDTLLKLIESESKVIKYKIGDVITQGDIIPDKIFLILSGEVRLTTNDSTDTNTIEKLKSESFIGLASFLRVIPSESTSAMNEVIVLSFPDKLILELFKLDSHFRNWCNTTIQPIEFYHLFKVLFKKTDIQDYNSFKNKLKNLISIEAINSGETIKASKNRIKVIGSNNLNDMKIGDISPLNKKVNTRGLLPARIFSIDKDSYNNLLNKDHKETKDNTSRLSNLQIEDNNIILSNSSLPIGQYEPKKEFKFIKAKGIVRESLACLQMLATELNLPYRSDAIEKIIKDLIKDDKKPTIMSMGNITTTMGLLSSIARIKPSYGGRLPYPSIISWESSFALVKKSNAEFLELASPSEGIIKIKTEDLEKKFEKGFIEILKIEKLDTTPEIQFGFQWLLPAINRHRGVLIQVLIASFVVQLFGLANPLMLQVIIDKVISQRSLDTLQILGFALVVITLLGGLISSLRTFLFNETTNRIDTRLGAEVIDHLLRLPLNYFDRRPVGELGTRIAELEKIRNFLTGQALTTILDAAFSLIYIVVMVFYSWLLTIIALGVVPIQILLTIIGTPLLRKQIREIALENASTQSHLVEVLTGIQTVKAQNVERVSRWKWQELYSKYISKTFQKTITSTVLGETSQVLQQLSQLLVLWIGASLVLKGQLSLGQLIAFRIISGYVTQPLLRLSSIWQNIQELRVSFERLADIVDTPEEASEADKAKIPLPSIKGDIKFEDISFNFRVGTPYVLKEVNLSIKQGQFVGIVGQSGSGKSTLVKLLPRLYNPNKGRIFIDGYDINKVELFSLRRQIGIVPQEPLLFKGTVSENIALTDPEAPSDEIVRAATIANAHEFIMGLKDGYSTMIGERGAGLSGGQKQRIAIARTLLNKPQLLIMDEATSALDYLTERNVCNGIKESCENSTVLFITHRLSTVRNADLIAMLHQGNIEELGTHEELMAKKGRYFALFQQQEASS
tara:strand:- start:135 stop:3077 length:2943 start_codon:yes stop_codon:yes gene_type:complete